MPHLLELLSARWAGTGGAGRGRDGVGSRGNRLGDSSRV